MKKYFAHSAYQNQAKNKAEEAVQKYSRELNGTLIYGEEGLANFCLLFNIKIGKINLNFPRCGDMQTEYRNYKELGGHWISASNVARIDFYEVKQEFPEIPDCKDCM